MRIDIKDIMQILDKEILWCTEHPDKAFHKEYRKGFINGIIQSKYLISTFSDLSNLLIEEKNEV